MIDKAMAALSVRGNGASIRSIVGQYTAKAAIDFHAFSGLPDGTIYYLLRNSSSVSNPNCITDPANMPSLEDTTALVLQKYRTSLSIDGASGELLALANEMVPIPLPSSDIQDQYVGALKEGRQYFNPMY
ncbi:MAG: hypothetical protein Q8K75_05335 [Chlamydiales bacterium]|nr:hypothetical protein [Chlamydiales bacterium]